MTQTIIAKINLKNYKYFDDLTLITENKEVIILIGPNGVGKSCIFDGISSSIEHSKYNSLTQNDVYHLKNINAPKSTEVSIEMNDGTIINNTVKKGFVPFYGRTSYRYTKEISRTKIEGHTGTKVEYDHDGRLLFNDIDSRSENDVEVALAEMMVELQKGEGKTDREIVAAVLNPTNESLTRIYGEGNIQIEKIIDPVTGKGKCDVIFKKKNVLFSFQNLSSGEKEIFDIIFNFHRRKHLFKNGVYYIDEPELHINTKIQRQLFNELVLLSQQNQCQLWISTHSLGFMRGAQDLEMKNPNKIGIFEFSEQYASNIQTLNPKKMLREDWKRIFETALDDLSTLINPRVIYYCEGKVETESGEEEGMDALIYKKIFAEYHHIDFISSGGGKNPIITAAIAENIFHKISQGQVKVLVLKDGDNSTSDGTLITDESRAQRLKENLSLRLLSRRELENFIFDPEVIKIYCDKKGIEFKSPYPETFDIVSDDVKKLKPSIIDAINHTKAWKKMPFLELAEIIFEYKESKLSTLYNILKMDLQIDCD